VQNLSSIDLGVIAAYFSLLVGLGFYLKRRASASLEDYFLGNRQLPWWALGVSGMASFLDMTGTMIIVSFLFMLGPRGLFVEFRGGAVLVLAIYMLWAGKWHRRSGCMTGAEWMVYRFGDGLGGQAARIARAVAEIVFTVGMLIYMAKGVGLFLSMFLPLSPFVCSLVLISVAAVYTMVSGFYGVVFTDMVQSVVILVAVVSISAMAFLKIADPESLSSLAHTVTGSESWLSSAPQLHTAMPEGYKAFESLGMFALFYLLRNIFFGMAEGDDPKYFGARSDRECGTLTFLWTWLMMFRWPMMMGFAVLGLYLVHDLFPDQGVIAGAAVLIKEHMPGVQEANWANVLAGIMHSPDAYSRELIGGLSRLLGEDWVNKLHLVSFNGTVDPERILPAVILFNIPMGLRGLLVIALIAASMSTFDSNVNKGAGYFTRDLYQRYMRPGASREELIYASWAFVLLVAATGLLLGFYVEKINTIWDWIIMGLGGGLLVPRFLRLYWWRLNGAGFAIGTLVGLAGAIAQGVFFPEWTAPVKFLATLGIGLVGTIVGTYLTQPTETDILERFFRTTRPFGLWGPVKRHFPSEFLAIASREHRNDLLAAPFALGWQITLFLLPMQLIVHSYAAFRTTLGIFLVCLAGMYVFWYRNLLPNEVKS